MQGSPEFPWDKEEYDSDDELSLDYNFPFQERESVQERPEFPWTQLLDWERDRNMIQMILSFHFKSKKESQ